jgi:exonuclease VII large subunit
MSVDETIAKEVLCVAQPAAVEAAILASEEETRKQDDVLDAWRRDLEAARYAAQRAQRQYDAADPQNRLVADELERRWNQALQRVQQIELRIEQHVHGQGKTTTPTREEFEDLAAKLEAVWNCPDGPWIFNRRAIETEAAAQFRARVRGSNRNPAIPTSKQSTLGFSTT